MHGCGRRTTLQSKCAVYAQEQSGEMARPERAELVQSLPDRKSPLEDKGLKQASWRKSVGGARASATPRSRGWRSLSQTLVKMRSDVIPPSPGDGLSDDSHRDDARRHDAGTPNPGFRRTGVGTGNSGSSTRHSHWGGVRLASVRRAAVQPTSIFKTYRR